jgi:hypothetical protein
MKTHQGQNDRDTVLLSRTHAHTPTQTYTRTHTHSPAPRTLAGVEHALLLEHGREDRHRRVNGVRDDQHQRLRARAAVGGREGLVSTRCCCGVGRGEGGGGGGVGRGEPRAAAAHRAQASARDRTMDAFVLNRSSRVCARARGVSAPGGHTVPAAAAAHHSGLAGDARGDDHDVRAREGLVQLVRALVPRHLRAPDMAQRRRHGARARTSMRGTPWHACRCARGPRRRRGC